MRPILGKIFDESTNILLKEEVQNILDDVSERNLCSRLAIHITNKLKEYDIKGYYADSEYNRKQGGKVKTILDNEQHIIKIQCDLIVHSRGNIHPDNLIAVEMKKSTRPEIEKEADRKRLRTMTQDSYDGVWLYDGLTHPEHVCGYFFGVYMILNIADKSCIIEYYQHGNLVNYRVQKF